MSLKKSPSKIKAKQSSSSKVKTTVSRKVEIEDLGDMTIVMDSRSNNDRRSGERREKQMPAAVERRDVGERRAKVSRRRQIDPTTCERDYSPEEVEFMSALDDYKRRNGRMFPTCSEILEVIKAIGYAKLQAAPIDPAITTEAAGDGMGLGVVPDVASTVTAPAFS